MSATEQQWELRRGQYLGEISALCFLHLPPQLSSLPLLLAGSGSQILVYELANGTIINSFQVLQGTRVHGISLEHSHKQLVGSTLSFRVAVFGERRVKLFSLNVVDSDGQQGLHLNIQLELIHVLPKFGHWVLDVCFLKRDGSTPKEDACYLAVGCTDNSVCFWDTLRNNVYTQVKCSERCLLYSMRMWGDDIEGLFIASGTIFNEIVVWKVVPQNGATLLGSHVEDQVRKTVNDDFPLPIPEYKDVCVSRLIGHEGSIFRITWSSSGLKLVSVSDDRCARIWEVQPERGASKALLQDRAIHLAGPVLFGHSARIWDCCIFDSLIITAGEDCTCRVWDHEGREIQEIKEHIGRGIWRCLYDPSSSLLVTAGFDSAIKVHNLLTSSKGVDGITGLKNFSEIKETFALSLPNSSGHAGLMDSKSEYVRCLQFSQEDSLYVATNNGYLYHCSLPNTGGVKWTELACIGIGAPIICMDLLSECSSPSGGYEDSIAIGDGKGSMTVVQVLRTGGCPKVEFTLTWQAEKERHLLGTYWCKSTGNRFIFTADPGGRLKLWKLSHRLHSDCPTGNGSYGAFLIAEYASCFGMRIMCVDASFDEELLVCGDIRGNLLLYALPSGLLSGTSAAAEVGASLLINYFKGAHGVSSVCSISIVGLCSDQVEVHSTGADGCICYLKHDKDRSNLEFIGMKQVKELSAIRSVFSTTDYCDDPDISNYAVGFASANFVVWNLTLETKVTQITCGGWRRPHSYYLGDLPEMMNCFSFVKDDIIHIQRRWIPENDRKIYPRNLHFQFHGREIHSLCFIYENSQCSSDENQGLVSGSSWIATGCEDGTVRLTRYEPGMEYWSSSNYLGEHVGGSAVRSICSVSTIHLFEPDSADTSNGACEQKATLADRENPYILISVGSKRVVTAWKQMIKVSNKRMYALSCGIDNDSRHNFASSSSATVSSLSFQWLSTDMPSKKNSCVNRKKTKEALEKAVDHSTSTSDNVYGDLVSSKDKMESNFDTDDNYENDWRYLDVTAFLVEDAGSRIVVCFVVVACSDTTVTLRAFVLPSRHWFDVASLTPLSSPVLALQHVVIPMHLPSKGNIQIGNTYLAITGSTDGSVAFWDLTGCVENFMRRISDLKMENNMETQKRPRTGRGSQGGRWWRSIGGHYAKKKPGDGKSLGLCDSKDKSNSELVAVGSRGSGNGTENHVEETSGTSFCEISNSRLSSQVDDQDSLDLRIKKDGSTPETSTLVALHVLKKVHQSGVNCLHVSDVKGLKQSDSMFSFYVVSGGDDQAINYLRCDLDINPSGENPQKVPANISLTTLPRTTTNCNHHSSMQNHLMQFVCLDKIISAHGSAVKGVWTDGIWVFSVGLDQRIRCWNLNHGKLMEHAHLIVSVPEPEALDVKACRGNGYQIAVAGRGMQMIEFVPIYHKATAR